MSSTDTSPSPPRSDAEIRRTLAGYGPHSKRVRRGKVSGRTRNGRCLKQAREELTQHLGGGPLSATQRVLVERVAWLRLHVALFDERVGVEPMSDRDRASYLAFSNSLVRATRELGLEPATPAVQLTAHSYAAAVPDEVFFARQREATS
jgi:hypothetical protein